MALPAPLLLDPRRSAISRAPSTSSNPITVHTFTEAQSQRSQASAVDAKIERAQFQRRPCISRRTLVAKFRSPCV